MRRFRAVHLPSGSAATAAPEAADVEVESSSGGFALELARFDQAGARALLRDLRKAGEVLRSRGNREIVQPLGRAGARFLDASDPLRREAEEWLPLESGFSGAVSRAVIEGMAAGWTEDALGRLLAAEFPDPHVLEGFRRGPEGDRIRASGDGLAFHVGAGNVAGVGATSVLRSMLVRTPLLMKPGRGDVVLPVLLARAIGEEDPELADALAVVYWSGGSEPELERVALGNADRVVVYGGTDTVDRIRRRLPPTTPLVAYHHRISLAAVGNERLTDAGEARDLATWAARSVAAYDQRGCVSPHLIWVERGGAVAPEEWAEMLADALAEEERIRPAGPAEPAVAARIHQLRGAAAMREAAEGGHRLFASPRGVAWTVMYEPDAEPEPSCTGRVVRVRPVGALEDLPGRIHGSSRVLQSVALEADEPRRTRVAAELALEGATRVTRFERQAWPRPWWKHDGAGPLRILVRWITLEDASPEGDPAGSVPD